MVHRASVENPSSSSASSHLPTEVIALLTRHLECVNDVLNCMLVCKSWCSSAERVLYRKLPTFSDLKTAQKEALLHCLKAQPRKALIVANVGFSLADDYWSAIWDCVLNMRQLRTISISDCRVLATVIEYGRVHPVEWLHHIPRLSKCILENVDLEMVIGLLSSLVALDTLVVHNLSMASDPNNDRFRAKFDSLFAKPCCTLRVFRSFRSQKKSVRSPNLPVWARFAEWLSPAVSTLTIDGPYIGLTADGSAWTPAIFSPQNVADLGIIWQDNDLPGALSLDLTPFTELDCLEVQMCCSIPWPVELKLPNDLRYFTIYADDDFQDGTALSRLMLCVAKYCTVASLTVEIRSDVPLEIQQAIKAICKQCNAKFHIIADGTTIDSGS